MSITSMAIMLNEIADLKAENAKLLDIATKAQEFVDDMEKLDSIMADLSKAEAENAKLRKVAEAAYQLWLIDETRTDASRKKQLVVLERALKELEVGG